jgi:hypothetical protein
MKNNIVPFNLVELLLDQEQQLWQAAVDAEKALKDAEVEYHFFLSADMADEETYSKLYRTQVAWIDACCKYDFFWSDHQR